MAKNKVALILKANHPPTDRDLERISEMVEKGISEGKNCPKGINWELEQ